MPIGEYKEKNHDALLVRRNEGQNYSPLSLRKNLRLKIENKRGYGNTS